MASEDDHLHLPCESSEFEEDKTLPKNASKQYGLQPYPFNPYQEETQVDYEHGSHLDCIEWWAFLLLFTYE